MRITSHVARAPKYAAMATMCRSDLNVEGHPGSRSKVALKHSHTIGNVTAC
jgi:hypothetical protein